MTLIISKRTQRVTSVMPFNKDVVVKANSGNPTLDNEDVFDITTNKTSWNFQGIVNQVSPKARIRGEYFGGVTRRGNKKQLYKQEEYDEFIEV